MRERKGGRSTQHIYNTNNFTLKCFKYVHVYVYVLFTSKAFLNCRDDINNSERILIASSSK